MPKPPMDPDTFDKVNYVIDMWSNPCEAPWYIYIETMKPAALAAFITLITFGWDDVARGYFRPKGLGARRTGKKKGKWRRAVPKFPELGEALGNKLPGATEVQGLKWNNLGKTLWRIDSALQAGLFWWLVADVVEDFAFDWTSTLYETEWCKNSAKGRFSFQTLGMAAMWDVGWKLAGFGWKDYEHGAPFWNFNNGGTGSAPATVGAALSFAQHPFFPKPDSFEIAIWDPSTHEILMTSGLQKADADSNAKLAIVGRIRQGQRFEVVCRMFGTPFALFGDGVVFAEEY